MKPLHDKHFPNESSEYRNTRNKLLEAEIALRRQTEEVAKLRRRLPLGGRLKEDYIFSESDGKKIKFSDLFQHDKDILVVYSMMFDPSWNQPCPMCNSIVDALNGNARQLTQRINLAVVGKAPIEKLLAYANDTGWKHVRIVSSSDNTYNQDYFGEREGKQVPMINVFLRKGNEIYHTWGSEMTFAPRDPGQDERLADIIWPLWNVLDLTPEGRGKDWYPKIV